MIPVLLTISSEGLCYMPFSYISTIFWRKVSKNALYDELYQILAQLPVVLIDMSGVRCLWFAARGKNWEDWVEGWRKSGGEVTKRKAFRLFVSVYFFSSCVWLKSCVIREALRLNFSNYTAKQPDNKKGNQQRQHKRKCNGSQDNAHQCQ